MKIELPNYHWFVSRHEGRFVTNIYSGSAGTVGNTGCISNLTFHYKVYVDISSRNASEFRLIAESYLLQPHHLGGSKTDLEKTEFVCSEDSLTKVASWLEEISSKHGF